MANPEHLKIFKDLSVRTWNRWRDDNSGVRPDFSNAEFIGADLHYMDLSGADLSRAQLNGVNLKVADLRGANLSGANLSGAHLNVAILRAAYLDRANLSGANLSGADLTDAALQNSILNGADLIESDFTNSSMGESSLGNIDLREAKAIETVRHVGPSSIGIDTIFRSHGKIPEIFLRGAGVPEVFISNMRSLVAAMAPIDFYSCFISYSTKDQVFAERLYADLQAKGVRCWYAPEDLRIGDKFRQRIDDAIRVHDKLLVVLSETSVASSWVESEVEAAFEKERTTENKTVLFPIRLDEAVMKTGQSWAADIRRTRHIGDFSLWPDHNSYQKSFQRLLRDLQGEKGEQAKP